MRKARAERNDWTLADAAVDTQLLINCWESMSDSDKLGSMHNLMDRLREGIKHEYVLEDAQRRIDSLRAEANLDKATSIGHPVYAIPRK